MAKRVLDLGLVRGLEAEALGVPGQRTFRLHAHSGRGTVRVWIEKEQLQELAATIERLLGEIAQVRGVHRSERETVMDPFPGLPQVEFHAMRIILGYDQFSDRVTIQLDEIVPEDGEDDPDPLIGEGEQVQLEMTRDQAHTFSGQALTTCAAGRPRCPLCGTPLDGPGHFCPRSNGHAPLPTNSED
jgi:uncharacterized repeat protein (TIGR03847 family)